MRNTCLFAMVVALILLAPASAQVTNTDYTRAQSPFPNIFAPYTAQSVPEPTYENTPRVQDMLQDGKLRLSLSDAIVLALENNLDLAIARYNLAIADTDILRSKSGASVRGVATGLVQGTPGGGVGGIGAAPSGTQAGGTATGAGGAGAGAAGIVQSTLGAGASVPSFDPVLTGQMSLSYLNAPQSNQVTTGVAAFQQNQATLNYGYQQAFHTGTTIELGFENSRTTNNSLFSILVPEVRSSATFSLRQRLLSGFGLGPNTRFIRIARNNREISDVAFRNQVIATVTQIENIYWDLVNAYEDVKVKQRSLELAEKTLSDNKKQVDIGTLAPIEIVRAEAEVATRQQELIQAQTQLQLQQLLMKNAVTRNLDNAQLADAEVVPTDIMELPAVEPVVPIQDLMNEAFGHRPELAEARIDLTNRDITRRAARNALLPSLDLVGWWGTSGLAGDQNPNLAIPGVTVVPTGYGDAFSDVVGGDFPNYGVGLQLNIPIRNRAAQADQVRSELELRQAELRMRQLRNSIAIEVRNAQFAVQQNRARVEAARKARELANESLDAEQKKYTLGASTNFLVLQAQRDVAEAESNLVAAMAAYQKSRVELGRVTGTTLDRYNISLGDAEKAQVTTPPIIPNVAPAKNNDNP